MTNPIAIYSFKVFPLISVKAWGNFVFYVFIHIYNLNGASLVAQWKRICLQCNEMQVRSLSGENPLEEGMATHSSVPAWRVPWTEEPGGRQSMGSQRVSTTEVTKHACM